MSGDSSPIRVLAVDDHPVVLQGIAGLIGVQADPALTTDEGDGHILRALKVGAQGYLLKDANDRTPAAIIGLRRGIIDL